MGRLVGLLIGALLPSQAWAVEFCGESIDPSEIGVSCNGYDKGLIDLEPLRGFPNLVAVSITHAELGDLSVLADLSLESLHLDNSTVAGGLAPIATLTTLRDLQLTQVGDHDFREVGALTELRELKLMGSSQLTSIEMLRPHTELTHLTLIDVPVTDLTPIAGATSLERLYCASVPIDTVPRLSAMRALRSVHITSSKLTSLGFLAGVPQLETLDLSLSGRLDLGPLAQLTTLRELDLSHADVTDIRPLYGLENLTKLRVFMADGVPRDQVDALRAARPDLRIIGP